MQYFNIILLGLSHQNCSYKFLIKVFGRIIKFQLITWTLLSNLNVIWSRQCIIYNICHVLIVCQICICNFLNLPVKKERATPTCLPLFVYFLDNQFRAYMVICPTKLHRVCLRHFLWKLMSRIRVYLIGYQKSHLILAELQLYFLISSSSWYCIAFCFFLLFSKACV